MNEYDSARLLDLLAAGQGYEVAQSVDEADLLLLNTCSIREKAQEKVFHQLGRWRKLKERNPQIRIAVGGCVASQEGDAIIKRAPFVDVVFGPQTLHRVPEMLALQNQPADLGSSALTSSASTSLASTMAQRPNADVQVVEISAPIKSFSVKTKTQTKPISKSKSSRLVDISFPEIEKFDCLPPPKANGPQAFVSIMEGCSKYCSFCVVPYTRGEEISRPVESIFDECLGLAAQGVREIHFLGQNVNAYRGYSEAGDCFDLAALITACAEIDGVQRIRFTTSHPMEFSTELIDVYREVPELVSHVHLPIQSGSDRILSLMKRDHRASQYEQIIENLRKIRPDISISSDFIVGFPGETEADFEQTMALIKRIGFDHSFSFLYSPRPGTPAAELVDETPQEVKMARLYELQRVLKQQAMAISDAMVGQVLPVLVIGEAKKGHQQYQGRTENNRVVNFDSQGESDLIGQIIPIKINEALPNSLRGERVKV